MRSTSLYTEQGLAVKPRDTQQLLISILNRPGGVKIGIGIPGIPDHTSEKNLRSQIAQKTAGDHTLLYTQCYTCNLTTEQAKMTNMKKLKKRILGVKFGIGSNLKIKMVLKLYF